jgi:hypothetical protein
VAAKPLGELDALAGDAGADASLAEPSAQAVVVVALVDMELGPTPTVECAAGAIRRNPAHECFQAAAVMQAGAGDAHRQRHAVSVGDEVNLRSRLATSGGLSPVQSNTIGDVTWEDVGNGYFIDPARDVLLRLREHGALVVGADQKAHGLVIGSNGGGLSYVMGPDGAVHRTRTASLDDPELDKVADDLRQFLELLERSLTRFVSDGEPGYL